MQQRRDEILAKKAKLAELKRQRELRANQTSIGRASISSGSEVSSPGITAVSCVCPDQPTVDVPNAWPSR